MVELFDAVRAVAIVLLAGGVLQASDVSASNGKVIDWRVVRCGDVVLEGGDAFDAAHLFVALVGPEAALGVVREATGEDPAAAAPVVVVPRVHAYAPGYDGSRRRAFDAGPFKVLVEPHEDDAGQAAFTAKLAELAAALVSRS